MTIKLITSDQEKQYKRFVEDGSDRALREIGPDRNGLQRLFMRGGEFQRYLVSGIRRFTTKVQNGYGLAKDILGQDFISPEEIYETRGITYTDEQLTKFGETLPSKDLLEWCRYRNIMLVAGPPQAMSILDIRAIEPNCFTNYSCCSDEEERGWPKKGHGKVFARNDKIGSGWLALLKEPVANSLGESWDKQRELVTNPMVVPNVAEVAWGLTTYKTVRGIRLFPGFEVRTSSVDSIIDWGGLPYQGQDLRPHQILVGYGCPTSSLIVQSQSNGYIRTFGVSAAMKL